MICIQYASQLRYSIDIDIIKVHISMRYSRFEHVLTTMPDNENISARTFALEPVLV